MSELSELSVIEVGEVRELSDGRIVMEGSFSVDAGHDIKFAPDKF